MFMKEPLDALAGESICWVRQRLSELIKSVAFAVDEKDSVFGICWALKE